jgi:hypothetical protein
VTDTRLRRFVAESRFAADNDLTLVKAIQRSSAAVVLGYFFHMDAFRLDDQQIDERESARRLQRIAGSKYPRIRQVGGAGRDPAVIRAYAPEVNLDISASGRLGGFFSLQSDPDSVCAR